MATNFSSNGNAFGIGTPGKTKKQSEMERSRSPLANNALNGDDSESPDFAKQTEANRQTPQDAKAKLSGGDKQYKQANSVNTIDPATVDLNAKLGQGSLSVSAAVNKFLTSPTEAGFKSDLGVKYSGGDSVDTTVPTINADGTMGSTTSTTTTPGSFKITGGATTDMSVAEQDKEAQLKALKDSAGFKSAFTLGADGKWVPKSFAQVAQEGIDSGEIGSYTALDKAKKTDHLMLLLKQLQGLEDAGMGNSSEAQAIQSTIMSEDDDGIVAGLIMAKDKYNRLTGKADAGKNMSWSGDSGSKNFNVADIANLTSSDISKEMSSALKDPAGGGLFGGDWATNMIKEIDDESSEYKLSSGREKKLNEDVFKAGEMFLNKWNKQFVEQDAIVNKTLGDLAPKIIEELKKSGAGKEAIAWFQTASKGDIAKMLREAIYDKSSGLGSEQRAQLEKYLGELTGQTADATRKGGMLASWMTELQKTGAFTDENGKKVQPNSDQKMDILNILNNSTMTDEQKAAALEKAFTEVAASQNAKLTTAMGEVLQGNMTIKQSSEQMFAGMISSMTSIVGSKLEETLQHALGVGSEVTGEPLAALITANPQLVDATIQDAVGQQTQEFNTQWNTANDKAVALVEKSKKTALEYRAKADAQKASDLGKIKERIAETAKVPAAVQAQLVELDKQRDERIAEVSADPNKAAAEKAGKVYVMSPANRAIMEKAIEKIQQDYDLQHDKLLRAYNTATDQVAAYAKCGNPDDPNFVANLLNSGNESLIAIGKIMQNNERTVSAVIASNDEIANKAVSAVALLGKFKAYYDAKVSSPAALLKINIGLAKSLGANGGLPGIDLSVVGKPNPAGGFYTVKDAIDMGMAAAGLSMGATGQPVMTRGGGAATDEQIAAASSAGDQAINDYSGPDGATLSAVEYVPAQLATTPGWQGTVYPDEPAAEETPEAPTEGGGRDRDRGREPISKGNVKVINYGGDPKSTSKVIVTDANGESVEISGLPEEDIRAIEAGTSGATMGDLGDLVSKGAVTVAKVVGGPIVAGAMKLYDWLTGAAKDEEPARDPAVTNALASSAADAAAQAEEDKNDPTVSTDIEDVTDEDNKADRDRGDSDGGDSDGGDSDGGSSRGSMKGGYAI
jgi:hypothetical protein